MASRSSRNTAPKVQQTEPRAAHPSITYFSDDDWKYSGKYYALQVQTPSDIDPRRIRLRVYDRVLTITLPGFAPERRTLPEHVNPKEGEAEWCVNTLWLRFPRTDVEAPAHASPIIDRENAEGPVKTIPIDFDLPVTPIIRPRKAKTRGREMVGAENISISGKTLLKGRVPYVPLSDAAPRAHAHRTTLLNWIKNKTKFGGRPLQSHYFAPLDIYFVSEPSIETVANRFIKWPSQKPAGPVTIGETDDQSGYLGTSDAARIIGVSSRTAWLWASQGKAPRDEPLDVIKCPVSDQYYIRHGDVLDLKKLVPKRGLQRGRRPQLAHTV